MTTLNPDVLSEILIKVGEASTGVKSLEKTVEALGSDARGTRATSVQRPECTERHLVVAQAITGLHEKLGSISQDIKEIKERSQLAKLGEKKRMSWPTIIGSAIALLSFLGTIALGIIGVGRHLERMDYLTTMVKQSQKAVQTGVSEMKKAVTAAEGPDSDPNYEFRASKLKGTSR